MSVYLPLRIFLLAAIVNESFKTIEYRNRFAACLASISTTEIEGKRFFLEILYQQSEGLNIDFKDSFKLLEFELERYTFYLNSNLVRIDKNKSVESEILFDYLSRNVNAINRFIYLHNYLNNPKFLFFVYFCGLISYEDFKLCQYITKLAYGLTPVEEVFNIDEAVKVKEQLKQSIYSLKFFLPLDISLSDPIFTVATN